MFVLVNLGHVKYSMHNLFCCICSWCIFYFIQGFCIPAFLATPVFIIENTAFVFSTRCFAKALKDKTALTLHLIIHSNQSGASEGQQLQIGIAKRWRRWHPPHRELVLRKESMSERQSIAFPRPIFCDVWEFYAFNDPCFALYQKTGTAD